MAIVLYLFIKVYGTSRRLNMASNLLSMILVILKHFTSELIGKISLDYVASIMKHG